MIFLASGWLNSLAKVAIGHPRPYDLNPSVGRAQPELGYGLPSGHAQNAVVIWGGLAAWRRSRAGWIGAVLIALLVGLSRIYRGVHFPTDVIGGWLIGIVLLAAGLALSHPMGAWVARRPLGWQVGLALAGPAALAALFPDRGAITAAGTLAGACSGMAISARRLSLEMSGTVWQRVLRLAVGLLILFVLYVGLKMVFPPDGGAAYLIFRFVRYVLLGAWVTLGAPWLFSVLHLTPQDAVRPTAVPTGT
jgi:undecaprenyl-diphosphatase